MRTVDYTTCLSEMDLRLLGYIEVDYTDNLDKHMSTSMYVFLLNEYAISWSSKKQNMLALSTMVEYEANVAVQVVWLQSLFNDKEVVLHASKLVTPHAQHEGNKLLQILQVLQDD